MEEKQAYFSLLQRELKITKFKGRAVGSSQMLRLWWIVSLDGQTHLSLKQEQSYRNCATAVLGALHTRDTGQLLSQPQHSTRGTLRCITFLLVPQESSPCCGARARQTFFLPSAALALLWELEYNLSAAQTFLSWKLLSWISSKTSQKAFKCH